MSGTVRCATLSLAVLLLSANAPLFPLFCEESADATGIVDSIAAASGMKDLTGITEISFTFSSRSQSESVTRQWQWFLKTDDIIFKGKDPSGKKTTVSYSRKALDNLREGASALTVDEWFTNDIYWLLFPYFLANDPQKRMVRNNSAVMPLSGKWATGIVVEYYRPDPRRPGERFEVFVDSTCMIKEWIVYPAQSQRPASVNKWENYRRAGPFTVSLYRPARDSKGTRVRISKVKVVKEGG
jgi:hypothetical protein